MADLEAQLAEKTEVERLESQIEKLKADLAENIIANKNHKTAALMNAKVNQTK